MTQSLQTVSVDVKVLPGVVPPLAQRKDEVLRLVLIVCDSFVCVPPEPHLGPGCSRAVKRSAQEDVSFGHVETGLAQAMTRRSNIK